MKVGRPRKIGINLPNGITHNEYMKLYMREKRQRQREQKIRDLRTMEGFNMEDLEYANNVQKKLMQDVEASAEKKYKNKIKELNLKTNY